MAQTITKRLQAALNGMTSLQRAFAGGYVQLVEVQKKNSRGGSVQEPPRFALTSGGTIIAILLTKTVNDDGSQRYTVLPPVADAQ